MAHIHREPYITLSALTADSALIAWGAFFFDVAGQEIDGRFKIIEDKDLKFIHPPRETSIGESSNFYGPARVEVREKKNPAQVTTVEVKGETPESRVNHTWVEGLKPAAHHFMLVQYKGGAMHVTPYGELKNGKLKPLTNIVDPKGKPFPLPLVVSLNG